MAKLAGTKSIDAFTRYQRRRNLSSRTIAHRRFRLMALAMYLNENGRELLDATTEDIEKFLDTRGVKKELSAQSRYTYISYFSVFYRWAMRERLCKEDPTEWLVKPKLAKRMPRPWDDDAFQVSLEQADARMRCWLLLPHLAGARCMEIANLRGEDIYRDRQALLLRGKGNKERVVPLHPDLLRALVAYGLPASGPVFTNRYGEAIKPGTVTRYIARHNRAHGLDATAHQGRHRYGTKVYRGSGGDLLMTQNLLGHASPSSTAIYAGWDTSKAGAVVDLL